MTQTPMLWTGAIAVLLCVSAARAHHSGSMYEATPIWIEGTVVRYSGVNPHSITTLEARSADGQVLSWAVEGPPGQAQLDRRGIVDVPQVGDVLRFCAFPYKPTAELSRMFPGVDFPDRGSSSAVDGPSPQFVAGHVLVMPDGEIRLWEPHGLISECIRTSADQRQSWLSFLNSSQRARQAWCEQRGYSLVQSEASLREFVEEINSLIDNPCR